MAWPKFLRPPGETAVRPRRPKPQKKEKIFAIGDVHGCATELRTLLNKLPLTPDCTVVMVGDYIDRGVQSREVIDTVLELRESYNVVTVLGNHEAMLLDFLVEPTSANAGAFIYNGGSATLASYADDMGRYHIPDNHVEYFRNLQPYYASENYFFVHAGLPDIALEELDASQHLEKLLWIRGPFHKSRFHWSKLVVHGHSRVQEVDFRPNRINLDTGCVYGGRLSAVELPEGRVYSVARAEKPLQVYLRDKTSRRSAIRFKGTVPVYVYRGEEVFEFETQDYSELGVYMRDILHRDKRVLQVGEVVRGHIGAQDHSLVSFEGEVVRFAEEEDGLCYALKIHTIDGRPTEPTSP